MKEKKTGIYITHSATQPPTIVNVALSHEAEAAWKQTGVSV